jgi:hypothetical protein
VAVWVRPFLWLSATDQNLPEQFLATGSWRLATLPQPPASTRASSALIAPSNFCRASA